MPEFKIVVATQENHFTTFSSINVKSHFSQDGFKKRSAPCAPQLMPKGLSRLHKTQLNGQFV